MPVPEKRCEKQEEHDPHRWSSASSPGTSFCEGVWRPHTYDEQKALFDRYHAGKEYVIGGVLHSGPYSPPKPNTSAVDG